MVFVLSRNFAVTCALFGYVGVNLPDFQHFWVNFGHFSFPVALETISRSDKMYKLKQGFTFFRKV